LASNPRRTKELKKKSTKGAKPKAILTKRSKKPKVQVVKEDDEDEDKEDDLRVKEDSN
jgi:hypothetical protein